MPSDVANASDDERITDREWEERAVQGDYDPGTLADRGYFDSFQPADRLWRDEK